MINQPIIGDMAKLVENLNRPIFTSSASLKDFIHKIVTRTEILALVSLNLNTNFKWNRPIPGDMPKVIKDLEGHFLLLWLQSTVLWQSLWPRLKIWHWSLFCWVPRSYDIDQRLVTSEPAPSPQSLAFLLITKKDTQRPQKKTIFTISFLSIYSALSPLYLSQRLLCRWFNISQCH